MASDHVAALDPKKSHSQGCATKHTAKKGTRCDYRHNGYEECSKVPTKKALYEIDFTVNPARGRLPTRMQEELKSGHSATDKTGKKARASFRVPKNPGVKKNKTAWFFEKENFKTAYLPYNHNYHHILPDTSLAVLSETVLKLLQSAGYNLNGKLNMIILPCTFIYGVAVQLPDHPGGHPDYNTDVESIVNEIKAAVQASGTGHRINNKNKGDMKTKLESWERREFNAIVRHGKTLTAGMNTNQVNKVPMAKATTG